MHRTATGTVSLSRTLRRACLAGGLTLGLAGGTLAAVATLPTSASAASPVALDAPENGTAPLIAYDSSTQTTYVAWSDPVQPGVDLCVLPAGATGCEGGAPVLLEDSKYPGYSVGNHPGLGGLVVLPNGEAVVIGTPVSTGRHHVGVTCRRRGLPLGRTRPAERRQIHQSRLAFLHLRQRGCTQ